MKRKKNNRKLFSAFFVIVCLVISAGTFFVGFRSYKPEKKENPVQGVSSESSLKGYLGKGYTYVGTQEDSQAGEEPGGEQAQLLPDEPEEPESTDTYETEITVTPEPTKEPEVTEAPEPTKEPESVRQDESQNDNDPEDGENGDLGDNSQENTVHYNENGDGDENTQEPLDKNDDRNQEGAQVPASSTPTPIPKPTQEPEEDHYPTIATDLTDGETVNASYRTFYVQAKDWYGDSLPSTSLEVYGNGQRLSSKGEPSKGVLAYRLDLNEGGNTIDIKATDGEGWSTTLPTFTIYKGEEGAAEPAGSVAISIEAGTIGLGTILPATSVDFYQGEQLSSVVLRLLQNSGLDWRNDGDVTGGFYLKAIGRGGIASGAAIPDDLLAHLNEVNCQLSSYDANWIGEFDFTMNSGWLYFVNGEYMNVGMSGYFPADGDEIRLRFSLYAGADVGAGQNGITWGDW